SQPAAERIAGSEQASGSSGLELEQPAERLVRPVEVGDAEVPPVFGGEGDTPEGEVTRNGLEEVDDLERGADVVAQRKVLRATPELVAEEVDEPGVGVEGANVRPQLARQRERGDWEILAARAFCHRGNVEHR